MNKNNGFNFLAGLVVGTVVGLLVAPKKGEDLRADLKVKANDVYDRVVSYDYATAKENVFSKVETVKETIHNKFDEVNEKSAEGIQNLKVKAEEIIAKVKHTDENVEEKVLIDADLEDEDLFEDL